ncbi:class I SAM-dependent methyltransferase [Microgenomates group bacterium]|nr:class I SAM-dependent methyltransferase [Microgenomates group bacterium]
MYLDGAEQTLLDFFKSQPSQKKITAFTKTNENNWPLLYHLSPRRAALLDWFPFKKSASLLEVGCGCGALTGFFCSQVARVTALEKTPARARITSLRHRRLPNLSVITSSLEELPASHKFDYLTLIGVLEYNLDALAFLAAAKKLLKPSGQLILAIENKLGLKYFASLPEDHLDQPYAGLNNYPSPSHAQTYSRSQLSSLLERSGFAHQNWYYPFPDYKLPNAIYHHSLLLPPLVDQLPLLSSLADTGFARQHTFSLSSVFSDLASSHTLPDFAPSFLIIASPKPL